MRDMSDESLVVSPLTLPTYFHEFLIVKSRYNHEPTFLRLEALEAHRAVDACAFPHLPLAGLISKFPSIPVNGATREGCRAGPDSAPDSLIGARLSVKWATLAEVFF